MEETIPKTTQETPPVSAQQTPRVIKQQLKEKPPKPKNLVVLLIVLILILLGSTGYLAYQNIQLRKQITQAIPSPALTTDPTAGWTTITKETFSIKIPPTWKENLLIRSFQNEFCFSTNRNISQESGESFIPGLADLCIGVKTDIADEYFEQLTDFSKTVIVDGKTGEQRSGYVGVEPSVYIVKTIVESNYGNSYIFSLATLDENLKQTFQKEYDQILSTFKFLD